MPAFPGMLPVINGYCVEQAVRTGLGLQGADQPWSRCSTARTTSTPTCRAGYQISQYQHPIVGKGKLEHRLARRLDQATIGITRLHLEQDAGKSLHDQHPTQAYIDLNRAGVALMEIVSEPDMRTPEEAGALPAQAALDPALSRHLRRQHGGGLACAATPTSRCARPATSRIGTRCEVKNVNSMRFVMQAIESEARRQIEILEGGGTVEQETRLFDPAQRRDALDALQGGGARLPLFPRPRPAAAGARGGLGRRGSRPACRSCRTTRRRASSATTGCRPTMPACWSPRRRPPTISRRWPRAATPSWRRTG